MMRWRQLAQVCLAAAVMTAGAATTAQAQAAEGGKLKVTVEYKGTAGTVDTEHKIWVWLFDTPDISAESMPLAVGALKENKATYKFIALPKKVYIAAALRHPGRLRREQRTGPRPARPSPSSAPPGWGAQRPRSRAGGDDAVVTVTFDDSIKMP